MDAFIERIVQEKKDLDTKIEGLTAFLGSEGFNKLNPVQKRLLPMQLSIMRSYSECLDMRLENLNR